MTSLGAHMWISYSPDLKHWGGHRVMLEARRGGWWDANKIGLCSPFIETEKGWLAIYHGVRQTAAGSIYRLGLALFDLKKPDVCLQRGDCWIFSPEAPYERNGDVPEVVFGLGGDDPLPLAISPAADANCCSVWNWAGMVVASWFVGRHRNTPPSWPPTNAGLWPWAMPADASACASTWWPCCSSCSTWKRFS
jgi:hypothetical protein